MIQYMLDTNTVSHALRGQASVRAQLTKLPIGAMCISVITEGEYFYRLARRPEATQLAATVREFLSRIDILPWDSNAAVAYGTLRARLQAQGRGLGNLDMLIAGHAIAADATLVTNDAAIRTASTACALLIGSRQNNRDYAGVPRSAGSGFRPVPRLTILVTREVSPRFAGRTLIAAATGGLAAVTRAVEKEC